MSTPAGEDQVLDQPPDLVVGERGDHRRAQAEAAAQAAGDVVLAAALPDPKLRAVRIRPSPGSSRSITSPSATSVVAALVGRTRRQQRVIGFSFGQLAAAAAASAVRRVISAQSPGGEQVGATIQDAADGQHGR